MDTLIRLGAGSATGLVASSSASHGGVTSGILIFAIGIVVGLSCVLAMDYLTRRRMQRDYRAWVQMGRPERRQGERRGRVFRRSSG